MKFVYFDASALAKRYSLETGSEQVDGIFDLIPKKRMTCAGINVGEVVSILVRKHNDGRLNDGDFATALAEFRREIIEDPDFVYLSFDNADIEASLKYILQYNLNATDAVILHSAFELHLTLRASGHELYQSQLGMSRLETANLEKVPNLFKGSIGSFSPQNGINPHCFG